MSNHSQSAMDKSEQFTHEEWQSRLESFPINRADLNKLVMNYLVTGEWNKKKQIRMHRIYSIWMDPIAQ